MSGKEIDSMARDTLRPLPSLSGRDPKKEAGMLADGKRFWAGLVFLVGLLAAGFGFRDKVGKFFTGLAPSALAARLDHQDARLDQDDEKWEHLHEEIRDARQDFRDYTAGKLQPLPSETPWPSPAPRSSPTAEVP